MIRSEPHITRLMQYGLMAQGYSLLRYGADGDWGNETQRAYDEYIAHLEAPETPAIINAIVDLSHHNRVADFEAAKADGISGVIHKATQGFRYTDPKYQNPRSKALDAGLLWGAYHFAVGGDGVGQAENFLSVVNPEPTDLLVLDLDVAPHDPRWLAGFENPVVAFRSDQLVSLELLPLKPKRFEFRCIRRRILRR